MAWRSKSLWIKSIDTTFAIHRYDIRYPSIRHCYLSIRHYYPSIRHALSVNTTQLSIDTTVVDNLDYGFFKDLRFIQEFLSFNVEVLFRQTSISTLTAIQPYDILALFTLTISSIIS